MKEYGCGQLMADGTPCSTAGNLPPMLCDVCLRKFVAQLEAAEHRVQRTAIAAFFVGGFVFLGIRWLVFGG